MLCEEMIGVYGTVAIRRPYAHATQAPFPGLRVRLDTETRGDWLGLRIETCIANEECDKPFGSGDLPHIWKGSASIDRSVDDPQLSLQQARDNASAWALESGRVYGLRASRTTGCADDRRGVSGRTLRRRSL